MFFTMTILLTPPAANWVLGRRWRRWKQLRLNQIAITLWLLALTPICSATAVYFAEFVLSQPYALELPANPLSLYRQQPTITQSALHGLTGWEGVDIKAGCGAEILAPFDGVVTYNGKDGYNHVDARGVVYEQATMLTIDGDELQLTLLHGDYAPKVGDRVKRGQAIGWENSHGWSTGCHSHVILRVNGRIVNFLDWKGSVASFPLRISTYRPELGGINCDGDCSTMASGDRVASWVGGRSGVFAAACPRSGGWSHGTRFSLNGMTFECRDTGGWINCYELGAYDPALKRNATESYCWVDLMGEWGIPYGSLAHNWYRIN